jgi:hypothetical protein
MNTDMKSLNKMPATQIQQRTRMTHHDQVGFTPEAESSFHIEHPHWVIL